MPIPFKSPVVTIRIGFDRKRKCAPITTRSTLTQRNGSETLSTPDTSRQAKSIPGQLSMLDLLTFADSISAISSPASAGGLMPCDLLAGPTIGLSGLDLVHASPSPSLAPKKALPIPVISGPSGESLSASARLQSSLESRLRAQLNGSDLCEVTWKPWNTPWGQCLSKPRARVRTISETDTGLWQTMVQDDALDRIGGKVNSRGEPKLSAQAIQASWPTPTTRDYKDGGYCPNVPVNGLLGRMVWPTPRASDGEKSPGMSIARQQAGRNPDTLHRAIRKLSGSSAPTEKPGALNPEFVCWLMGYPTEWVSCGVSVTRSIRGRAPNSSVRT